MIGWCVTPVTGMADIKSIREACGLHGLAAEWRHRHECYAVFRPLTSRTICLFESIDVEDPELAAMEWSMMEMFDDTPPRYWRPV